MIVGPVEQIAVSADDQSGIKVMSSFKSFMIN